MFQRSAQAIGKRINDEAPGFGLDPVTIIAIVTQLLPILASCFNKSPDAAGQTPREFLLSHYDQETESFDQHLIDRARHATRKAARDNGQNRLSRHQLDTITEQTYYEAMQQTQAAVAEQLAAAGQ